MQQPTLPHTAFGEYCSGWVAPNAKSDGRINYGYHEVGWGKAIPTTCSFALTKVICRSFYLPVKRVIL